MHVSILLHRLRLCAVVVERDPSKRRVKPVEPHLLQLDFADIGSSSDDSDFKLVSDHDSGSYVLLLYCTSALLRVL